MCGRHARRRDTRSRSPYEGQTIRLSGGALAGRECGGLRWHWWLLWLIWPLAVLVKSAAPLVAGALGGLAAVAYPLAGLLLIGLGAALLLRERHGEG